MYEALAANTANINLLVVPLVASELNKAKSHPFNKGVNSANRNGNLPKEKKDFNFFPFVITLSKRKIARKPLKRSFVKGLIPSAFFAFAK